MPTTPPTEQEERDQVLAYLRSHPDLLDRYPELLADLIIPHGAGLGSLIERQVQVLRERNLRLEGTLDELLRHARQNEALLDKVHELALALLCSTDLSARIEARALGHPLLAAGSRVNNDVSVGPPGTFVFVTGSNTTEDSRL